MDNIIAEALMLKMKDDLDRIEKQQFEANQQFERRKQEVMKIRELAQEYCTHPNTHGVPQYDPHHNLTWTETVCNTCCKVIEEN